MKLQKAWKRLQWALVNERIPPRYCFFAREGKGVRPVLGLYRGVPILGDPYQSGPLVASGLLIVEGEGKAERFRRRLGSMLPGQVVTKVLVSEARYRNKRTGKPVDSPESALKARLERSFHLPSEEGFD